MTVEVWYYNYHKIKWNLKMISKSLIAYTKFWFIVSGLSISNVTILLIVINKLEKRK